MALYADDGTASINDDGTDKDGLETEVLPPEWDLSVDTLSNVKYLQHLVSPHPSSYKHIKINNLYLSSKDINKLIYPTSTQIIESLKICLFCYIFGNTYLTYIETMCT